MVDTSIRHWEIVGDLCGSCLYWQLGDWEIEGLFTRKTRIDAAIFLRFEILNLGD